MSELIKVKRSGPRGWHLIDAVSFDPSKHELWEEAEQARADKVIKTENAGIPEADRVENQPATPKKGKG